ncbi:putative receptor-like protein kinase [Camellia lanceoleosa]|nr:putative receptor-like protein kinase [Camellia lanceoleosa]
MSESSDQEGKTMKNSDIEEEEKEKDEEKAKDVSEEQNPLMIAASNTESSDKLTREEHADFTKAKLILIFQHQKQNQNAGRCLQLRNSPLEMFMGKRPIDIIFKDGLNLHRFTKMALPERVMEIVDPSLLLEVGGDDDHIIEISKTKECLVVMLTIGVSCSMESLGERMHMRDVVADVYD